MLPFFEGIIAAFGALILELSPIIFNITLNETTVIFFLFTAVIEELTKYIFIYNHYLKSTAKEKILRDVTLIGFGFAIAEIFIKQPGFNSENIFAIMGIFFVHLSTATLLGLFFWKTNKHSIFPITFILASNILLHFFYNFLILRFS